MKNQLPQQKYSVEVEQDHALIKRFFSTDEDESNLQKTIRACLLDILGVRDYQKVTKQGIDRFGNGVRYWFIVGHEQYFTFTCTKL